ncbi:uncharacterized protein LOC34622243 [Cyclospora cayetanensis]|uniref:Uncharacterized protein LOC34622243 n=1 Tax=Cyclospora cayetanensis TaxID=88456 RepID=A0A6P6RSW0_9EIME|nr:uncharacterized protein LOC34622243 [Cyclospora cayetanensis]
MHTEPCCTESAVTERTLQVKNKPDSAFSSSPLSSSRLSSVALTARNEGEMHNETGNISVFPFPVVFANCQPGSWVRKHIRLTNKGKNEQKLAVTSSNPSVLFVHREALTLPPGASVFLPIIMSVPSAGNGTGNGGSSQTGGKRLTRECLAIRGMGWSIDLPVLVTQAEEHTTDNQASLDTRKRASSVFFSDSKLKTAPSLLNSSSPLPPRRSTRRSTEPQRRPLTVSLSRSDTFKCSLEGSCDEVPITHSADSWWPAPQGLPSPQAKGPSPSSALSWGLLDPSDLLDAKSEGTSQSSISPALLASQQPLDGSRGASRLLPSSPPSTGSPSEASLHYSGSDSCCNSSSTVFEGRLRAVPKTEGDNARYGDQGFSDAGGLQFAVTNKGRFCTANTQREPPVATEARLPRRDKVSFQKPHWKNLEDSINKAQIPTAECSGEAGRKGAPASALSRSLQNHAQLAAKKQFETVPGKQKEVVSAEAEVLTHQDALVCNRKKVEALERLHGQQHAMHQLPAKPTNSSIQSLYPFHTLGRITAEDAILSDGSNRHSECTHIGQFISTKRLREQQWSRAAHRQQDELRKLKAALAAAHAQHKKQQTLLQRRLHAFEAEAAVAAAEAAAAREREKHLQLQIEEQQQRFAAAERSAATKYAGLFRQFQAAMSREKNLQMHLKAAQASLTFLSSLRQQQRACTPDRPLDRLQGGHSIDGAARKLRKYSSQSCSSSHSSSHYSNTGRGAEPQETDHLSDGEQKKASTGVPPDAVCFLKVPAEIQHLIDHLDTARGSEAARKADAVGSVPPAGIAGSCCVRTRGGLQQRLAKATAELIAKTQLLAAREAAEEELQQQAADSSAAAVAAEKAAAAAEKKLLCAISRNAEAHAELTAAAAAKQAAAAAAKASDALVEKLRASERQLQLQCEALKSERDSWKQQLQKHLRQRHKLLQKMQQQHVRLHEEQSKCPEEEQQSQQHRQLQQDLMLVGAPGDNAPAFPAAAVADKDSAAADGGSDPLILASAPLLVSWWPEGQHDLPSLDTTTSDGSVESVLRGRAEQLVFYVSSVLLAVGRRLAASSQRELRVCRENRVLLQRLKGETARRIKQEAKNEVLSTHLKALDAKSSAMESFAAAEAEAAAEHHRAEVSLLSRQHAEALGTLKSYEEERALLLSRHLAVCSKVQQLRGALRRAVQRGRKAAAAAAAGAEDAVLQRLSDWRESLMRTTVEAAESCRMNPCCGSRSGSCCSSKSRRCCGEASPWDQKGAAGHLAAQGLAQRLAAAELAVLQLRQALARAYQGCAGPYGERQSSIDPPSYRSITPTAKEWREEKRGLHEELRGRSSDASSCGVPGKNSAPRGRKDQLDACVDSFTESARHPNILRNGQSSVQTTREGPCFEATCPSWDMDSSPEPEERALAEAARLMDCVKAMNRQKSLLEAAAAKGEAAELESEALRTKVALLQQRELVEALKTAQTAAAVARQQLEQQEGAVQQLHLQVQQLQQDAAERLHVSDRLHEALTLCKGNYEKDAHSVDPRGGQKSGVGLLVDAMAFSLRLTALEKEKAVAVLPQLVLQQPHTTNSLPAPQPTEELLLAHRLLLGDLLQALPHSGDGVLQQQRQEPQCMHREDRYPHDTLKGKPLKSKHQTDSAAATAGAKAQVAGAAASCRSLAAAAAACLLRGEGSSLLVTLPKTCASCSKCMSRGIATSAAALGGLQKQRAAREAEAQALRLLQQAQRLGGPLLFIAAAQHRLSTLLTFEGACSAPLGTRGTVGPAQPTAPLLQLESADTAVSLLLLQQMQGAAAATVDTLVEAHSLSLALGESLAALRGGAPTLPGVSSQAVQENPPNVSKYARYPAAVSAASTVQPQSAIAGGEPQTPHMMPSPDCAAAARCRVSSKAAHRTATERLPGGSGSERPSNRVSRLSSSSDCRLEHAGSEGAAGTCAGLCRAAGVRPIGGGTREGKEATTHQQERKALSRGGSQQNRCPTPAEESRQERPQQLSQQHPRGKATTPGSEIKNTPSKATLGISARLRGMQPAISAPSEDPCVSRKRRNPPSCVEQPCDEHIGNGKPSLAMLPCQGPSQRQLPERPPGEATSKGAGQPQGTEKSKHLHHSLQLQQQQQLPEKHAENSQEQQPLQQQAPSDAEAKGEITHEIRCGPPSRTVRPQCPCWLPIREYVEFKPQIRGPPAVHRVYLGCPQRPAVRNWRVEHHQALPGGVRWSHPPSALHLLKTPQCRCISGTAAEGQETALSWQLPPQQTGAAVGKSSGVYRQRRAASGAVVRGALHREGTAASRTVSYATSRTRSRQNSRAPLAAARGTGDAGEPHPCCS